MIDESGNGLMSDNNSHLWEVGAYTLAVKRCKHCGLTETEPTEECPRRPVTDEERTKIKEKDLDYRGGKWRHYVNLGKL